MNTPPQNRQFYEFTQYNWLKNNKIFNLLNTMSAFNLLQ